VCLPSGRGRRVCGRACPSQCPTPTTYGWGKWIQHTLIERSWLAEYRSPSQPHLSALTAAVCPLMENTTRLLTVFQILTCPSLPPEARRVHLTPVSMGSHARLVIHFLWPRIGLPTCMANQTNREKERTIFPVFGSQTRISASIPLQSPMRERAKREGNPEASSLPSGENDTAKTQFLWPVRSNA
jgi:hypothetical protein